MKEIFQNPEKLGGQSFYVVLICGQVRSFRNFPDNDVSARWSQYSYESNGLFVFINSQLSLKHIEVLCSTYVDCCCELRGTRFQIPSFEIFGVLVNLAVSTNISAGHTVRV